MKTCPECAEDVKEAAQVCRFCGHRFDGESRATTRREGAGGDGLSTVWKIALLLTGGIALAGTSIYEGQRQKGPRQDSVTKSQAETLSSLVEQCEVERPDVVGMGSSKTLGRHGRLSEALALPAPSRDAQALLAP